jgi:hypothetical protein
VETVVRFCQKMYGPGTLTVILFWTRTEIVPKFKSLGTDLMKGSIIFLEQNSVEARLFILVPVWQEYQHRNVKCVWARFLVWCSPELRSCFGAWFDLDTWYRKWATIESL